MKWLRGFGLLFMRLQYPVSLPGDVAEALGISMSNYTSCNAFLRCLKNQTCSPTRLMKYMPRAKAEAAFSSATRRECFRHTSLFSFYFKRGWLEFVLHFDEENRLRRLYMQHRDLCGEDPIEIPLATQCTVQEIEAVRNERSLSTSR